MPPSGANVVKHISRLHEKTAWVCESAFSVLGVELSCSPEKPVIFLHLCDLNLHWAWKPPRLLCPLTLLPRFTGKRQKHFSNNNSTKLMKCICAGYWAQDLTAHLSVNLLNSLEKPTQLGSPSHGGTEAQRSNLCTEPLPLQKSTYLTYSRGLSHGWKPNATIAYIRVEKSPVDPFMMTLFPTLLQTVQATFAMNHHSLFHNSLIFTKLPKQKPTIRHLQNTIHKIILSLSPRCHQKPESMNSCCSRSSMSQVCI